MGGSNRNLWWCGTEDKINQINNTSVVPPRKNIIAKIDSGCSGHFFPKADAKAVLDDIKYAPGPTGILPDKRLSLQNSMEQYPFNIYHMKEKRPMDAKE